MGAEKVGIRQRGWVEDVDVVSVYVQLRLNVMRDLWVESILGTTESYPQPWSVREPLRTSGKHGVGGKR